MNPLSLIPSAYLGWVKVIAIGALALALVAGVLWLRHTWMEDGRKEVRAEWAIEKQAMAEAALAASEAARAKERVLTVANERIRHDLAKEKATRVAAAAALDDSLRQLQAALGNPASGDTAPTTGTHGTGGPERELLADCAKALSSLAGEADRLESKTVGLQGYVNTVVFGAIDGKAPPVDYTIKPPAK